MNLTSQKCVPCEVGGTPLPKNEVDFYLKDLPAWKVSADYKKIYRDYKFKDFKEALAFVNKVGELAENEGHHPDFNFTYGKVLIELWTHEVGGLSMNDVIMAAKIDAISPK